MCLQDHILAEVRTEINGRLLATEQRDVLKAKSNVKNGRLELRVKESDLDFDPHLLVVKAVPRGNICILKRAKDVFHVELEDSSFLSSAEGTSFEIIAGLSEYAKLLYAVNSEEIPQYLLDGSGPPALNFTGWETCVVDHKLNASQAQAVQRYLNTISGVMLLEGPPGTGKSYTISVLVKCLVAVDNCRIVVITAPSNKAVESIARKLEDAQCDYRIVAREEKLSKDLLHRRVKVDEVRKCGVRIVLCTMSKCFQLSSVISDVELIIDEAGQASQPLTLVPFLLRPHRCLMVGDMHQLRPLVRHSHAKEHHFDMSMLERLQLLSVAEDIPVPRLLEGRRCAEEIMAFSNREFYGDTLVSSVNRDLLEQEGIALSQLCMIDVKSRRRPDCINDAEIKAAREILKLFKTRPGIDIKKDVVVLCFYNNQLFAMDEKLRRSRLVVPNSSVDSFQGGEKKIVLISFSKSCNGAGFLADPNRLNVALTRAQDSLVLIGDHEFLTTVGKDNVLGRLMQHVEDTHVRKSLHECLVRSDVSAMLDFVDETNLPNFFQPLRLPFELALVMKKIEAASMSCTVHSDLVSRACAAIEDGSAEARKTVQHYTTRKYASIQNVEEGSDLQIFCALRDFHALEFSQAMYEEMLAVFVHLSAVIHNVYLRLMARNTALWIRFRLNDTPAVFNKIVEEYHDLDEEYREAGLFGTQHLLKCGTVLLRMERHPEAIKVLKRVADVDDLTVHALNCDDVYAARCMLAEALHHKDPGDKKVRLYLRSANNLCKIYSMQRAWSFEMLAGSFLDAGNNEEAFNLSKEALMRNPGNAHACLIHRCAERLRRL